ncbi:hypothetical protein ACN47E_002063 [Coniothyrium glycines]
MALSPETTTSRSSHVADPALAPFLQPRFDPAEYLNATLPQLSLSSVASRPLKPGNGASLADLTSQTQDLLSQLNAHTTRLSGILTQLTDDILRTGGRLAYEVEVLRGEAFGLAESLTDGLKNDIVKIVPGGISLTSATTNGATTAPAEPTNSTNDAQQGSTELANESTTAQDITPSYLSDLRTLTTVRTRLEAIIKIFGEAMHWTLPPSEVSLGASLISVSAPEPGTDSASREQKGKEFAVSLRSEIADLITGDPDAGKDKAEVRIKALRDLATVWKGTAEEKARIKFIEGLVKLADDKQKEVDREKERNKQRPGRAGSVPKPQAPATQQKTGGFLENLQRIRGFVE